MFKKVNFDSPHGGLNQFIFFCLSLFKEGLGHGVSNLHIKKKTKRYLGCQLQLRSYVPTFLCPYDKYVRISKSEGNPRNEEKCRKTQIVLEEFRAGLGSLWLPLKPCTTFQ